MEDKIEVGEYVRTNDGVLGKLLRIERDDIDTSLKWYVLYIPNKVRGEVYINKPYIVKHSKNIKKLIEAEDCLIYKLKGINSIRKGFVKRHVDPRSNKENLSIDFYGLEQIEILEIVTKEQFNSVKYEV